MGGRGGKRGSNLGWVGVSVVGWWDVGWSVGRWVGVCVCVVKGMVVMFCFVFLRGVLLNTNILKYVWGFPTWICDVFLYSCCVGTCLVGVAGWFSKAGPSCFFGGGISYKPLS